MVITSNPSPEAQQDALKMARKGVSMKSMISPSMMCVDFKHLEDSVKLLIMTVNPGYAGQKLIPSTIGKIIRLREYLHVHGYDRIAIEVDGNVSFENAQRMKAAGADIFVAGTSSLFTADTDLLSSGQMLRAVIS